MPRPKTKTSGRRTSAMPSEAIKRLGELRLLRLQGKRPVGAIMVTNESRIAREYEEMGLATIELWRGDAPDWSPILGLWVVAVLIGWDYAQRRDLHTAIRAAKPSRLHWYALTRRGGLAGIGGEIGGVPHGTI